MEHLSKTIELRDVEHAIDHQSRWLRFPARIEQAFEAHSRATRSAHIIKYNIIGLIIYHTFLFGDYHVVRDMFAMDLLVHFLVMTTLIIAINTALARHPPTWLREGLEMGGMIILCATIIWIATASRLPNRDLVQSAVLLVILFATLSSGCDFGTPRPPVSWRKFSTVTG